MKPVIKKVVAKKNYILYLLFDNGEEKILDMKPYLNFGIFKELQDEKIFNSVKICFDAIEWNNEADLSPEFIYKKSILINANELELVS